MQPRTSAVPMSGCFRMRTPEMPSTARTGTMTVFGSAAAWVRRVSRSAANTARASFISSDGCTCSIPNPIHRDDPPADTPRWGTSTTTSRPMVTTTRGAPDLAPLAVVHAGEEDQGAGADPHVHGLADEDGPRRPVEAEGDDRRGRAHHDQAEDAEHARPGRPVAGAVGTRASRPRRAGAGVRRRPGARAVAGPGRGPRPHRGGRARRMAPAGRGPGRHCSLSHRATTPDSPRADRVSDLALPRRASP